MSAEKPECWTMSKRFLAYRHRNCLLASMYLREWKFNRGFRGVKHAMFEFRSFRLESVIIIPRSVEELTRPPNQRTWFRDLIIPAVYARQVRTRV